MSTTYTAVAVATLVSLLLADQTLAHSQTSQQPYTNQLRSLQAADWDEWYVGFVSAQANFDGGDDPNVYLTYNGPAPLNTEKYYQIRVMDPTCSEFVTGGAVATLDPDGIITLPFYNADLGTIAAPLQIDTATIQSSDVFYTAGTVPEQFSISFCARMSLFDSTGMALATENTIVNFSVDTTQSFEIDDLQFEPEAASVVDEDVLVDFPLDIYPCDDSNRALPIVNIFPGQDVQVCISSGSDEARVVDLRSVRMDNSEDEDLQIPLVNANSDVASQQAVLNCGSDGICNLKTVAYARLFEKPMEDGSILDISATSKMTGTAILELVSSGRRLQQGNSAASATGFETDIDLATPPPADSSAASLVHSLIVAGAAVVGCLMMAI